MKQPFVYPPFGSIDIPKGGKLPPAPSYLAGDGKEWQGSWHDVTCEYDPKERRLLVPVAPMLAAVLLIEQIGKRRIPWNND